MTICQKNRKNMLCLTKTQKPKNWTQGRHLVRTSLSCTTLPTKTNLTLSCCNKCKQAFSSLLQTCLYIASTTLRFLFIKDIPSSMNKTHCVENNNFFEALKLLFVLWIGLKTFIFSQFTNTLTTIKKEALSPVQIGLMKQYHFWTWSLHYWWWFQCWNSWLWRHSGKTCGIWKKYPSRHWSGKHWCKIVNQVGVPTQLGWPNDPRITRKTTIDNTIVDQRTYLNNLVEWKVRSTSKSDHAQIWMKFDHFVNNDQRSSDSLIHSKSTKKNWSDDDTINYANKTTTIICKNKNKLNDIDETCCTIGKTLIQAALECKLIKQVKTTNEKRFRQTHGWDDDREKINKTNAKLKKQSNSWKFWWIPLNNKNNNLWLFADKETLLLENFETQSSKKRSSHGKVTCKDLMKETAMVPKWWTHDKPGTESEK